MPYGRDEWLERFRQRRAEQIRLIYRQRIRRSQLKGGSEHDRSRNITPEQVEHAHDSSAYDPVIPAPAPRPEDTPGNGGRQSKSESGSSTEQSTGQASNSESGKKSSRGSSQTEDAPNADQAKDVKSAKATPSDIAEVQDDFGTNGLVDSISWDRLHRYSNLDLILVQQDMERRPLTFKRCFELAESPRTALEFIYAEPPNLDDNAMIHLQDYLSQEPGTRSGWWANTSDGEDSGTLDIDTGLLSTVHKIEEHLESEYGYQIKWGKGISNADKLEQLHELAEASEHIVDYLDLVYKDDPNITGKEAFREHFSESEDHEQLVVNLGADAYFAENFSNISEEEAGYYGHVPAAGTNRVYLGSKVDIPTIVHEFGHVIDKSKGFTAYLQELVPDPADPSREISRLAAESGNYFDEVNEGWRSQYSFNLNENVLNEVIEGFVAKQFFAAELWADLFMTAVLSGEGFTVKSVKDKTVDKAGNVTDDPIGIFMGFDDPDGPIFRCRVNAPCFDRTVEWEQGSKFADAAQWYLPRVFHALLSG